MRYSQLKSISFLVYRLSCPGYIFLAGPWETFLLSICKVLSNECVCVVGIGFPGLWKAHGWSPHSYHSSECSGVHDLEPAHAHCTSHDLTCCHQYYCTQFPFTWGDYTSVTRRGAGGPSQLRVMNCPAMRLSAHKFAGQFNKYMYGLIGTVLNNNYEIAEQMLHIL